MSELSPLEELQVQINLIRDRVVGVESRQHNGFYLYGRAGTSKTYTVMKTLEDMGAKPVYKNSHLTDMGLFKLLDESSESTIVLDDMSQLFKKPIALNILLAACGNQPTDRSSRIVSYKQKNFEKTIHFSGGIIVISNLELCTDPIGKALSSRMNCLEYKPSDEQMEAMIMDVASKPRQVGDEKMTAKECTMVAEFLIAESHRMSVPLDMRNLIDKGYPDYIQHRLGMSLTHWKDLIRSTLEGSLKALKHTPAVETRASERMNDQIIVRSLTMNYPDKPTRVAKWIELTGKSQATFYRIAKQLGL